MTLNETTLFNPARFNWQRRRATGKVPEMGSLLYGSSGMDVHFDDRALAHLQIVIVAKLRRRESFIFSWNNSVDRGGGRSSIWLDPSSTLLFRYSGGRSPIINREWIDLLMMSANSPGGLNFSPEPGLKRGM